MTLAAVRVRLARAQQELDQVVEWLRRHPFARRPVREAKMREWHYLVGNLLDLRDEEADLLATTTGFSAFGDKRIPAGIRWIDRALADRQTVLWGGTA